MDHGCMKIFNEFLYPKNFNMFGYNSNEVPFHSAFKQQLFQGYKHREPRHYPSLRLLLNALSISRWASRLAISRRLS